MKTESTKPQKNNIQTVTTKVQVQNLFLCTKFLKLPLNSCNPEVTHVKVKLNQQKNMTKEGEITVIHMAVSHFIRQASKQKMFLLKDTAKP